MQLEDACDESPQAEQLLELCRQDAEELRTFATAFHSSCTKTMEGITTMISGLTEMLDVSKQIHTRVSRDEDPNVSFLQSQSGLQTLIVYMGEVCGIMHNMANDLSNNMMFPIDRFVRADLEALDHRSAVHCASSEQYKEMAEKYSRLSHRKTDAKTRGEQLEHVRSARSQARDSTLDYFAALHALNQKRSYLFLEPLLGYLRAFVVATRASADAIAKRDVETNLTVFDEFVKSEHRDLTADQRRLEARIDAMRAQQQAEAVAARSHASEGETKKQTQLTVDTEASQTSSKQSLQKSGYLFKRQTPVEAPVRSTVASFLGGGARREAAANVWERVFVFVQGGNLMVQGPQDLAGSSVADLQDSSGVVRAEAATVDDRFATFLVSFSPLPPGTAAANSKAEKRTLACFQCESESERSEWIRLLNLNAGFSEPQTPSVSSTSRSASVTPADVQLTSSAVSQDSPFASQLQTNDAVQPVDLDTALEFVPIQFDLIESTSPTANDQPTPDSNSTHLQAILSALSLSTDTRVNPFNSDANPDNSQSVADEIATADSADNQAQDETKKQCANAPQFLKHFTVRFVGSMQIGEIGRSAKLGRDELVSAAIRKMLLSRVMHDMAQMLELELVVTDQCVALLDKANQHKLRTLFDLQLIAHPACYRENARYFGFFVRRTTAATPTGDQSDPLECFAFECDSASGVYDAFKLASRVAFQASIGTKSNAKSNSPSLN